MRLHPLRDLGRVGFLPGLVQRLPVERIGRHERGGVLAGIEVGVVRRTVEVDDVARMGRDEHRGAELVEEVVKALEVPVRIRQQLGVLRHPSEKRAGDMRAGVRHRH